MQGFAKELIALQPDLILANNTPMTAAVLQQTSTIPIIFAVVADPVGSGFVASFPQPGGNVTGFNVSEPTLAGKFVELLKEIAPHVARVAMLFNPATTPYRDIYLNPFKAAAASFAVEAITAPVHDRSELESVVAAQAREPNSGLIVMPDGFMNVHRAEVTSLAARYRLPAVYPYRFWAALGGLLSYGPDQIDNLRRAATYVDLILKGAKPSELPSRLRSVRAGDQSRDRQGARPRRALFFQQRADRLSNKTLSAALHMSATGTLAHSPMRRHVRTRRKPTLSRWTAFAFDSSGSSARHHPPTGWRL
jgi:ABC-type uncharacterized transport system substrate-binding protein